MAPPVCHTVAFVCVKLDTWVPSVSMCATQACMVRDAAGSAPPASTPPPVTTLQASVSVTRATQETFATKFALLVILGSSANMYAGVPIIPHATTKMAPATALQG